MSITIFLDITDFHEISCGVQIPSCRSSDPIDIFWNDGFLFGFVDMFNRWGVATYPEFPMVAYGDVSRAAGASAAQTR